MSTWNGSLRAQIREEFRHAQHRHRSPPPPEETMHRLSKSDEELSAYFTSARGLHAQIYDVQGTGGGGDAHDAAIARCARQPTRTVDRVTETLFELGSEPRKVLESIYGRRAGAFERGAKEVALDVDFLARALAPRWGHGTFLWVVQRLERAVRAWERRRRAGEAMTDFLRREAEPSRAKETRGFFGQLVAECEQQIRMPALVAYDHLRTQRIARRIRGEGRSGVRWL